MIQQSTPGYISGENHNSKIYMKKISKSKIHTLQCSLQNLQQLGHGNNLNVH